MSSDEKKKISGIMVLEVLGRPLEYLTEVLNDLIKKMGEEKGVFIKEKKIMEPVPMKEKPDFYSSFAEIEVETEDVLNFALLMFKYMPAHVEIISPQSLNLSNSGFNDIFNELTRRLHGYEELARILQTEKMILENQLKTILGEKKEEMEEMEKKEEKGGKQEVSHSLVKAERKKAKEKKPRKLKAKKAKEKKWEVSKSTPERSVGEESDN